MGFHAFVAMPFGVKEGINFNEVYSDLIKPALESEGFVVFRADEEVRAGNIRTDMFQELLLADLVVADLSIDNPNVWYELGVRHALRARGVIQIQCRRDHLPFDVYVDRVLRYHVKDGKPDPSYLEKDKKALAAFATETMTSWHSRKISPVYHLLDGLTEQNWKTLRVSGVREFWEKHKLWEDRIELARKGNRPGDILVLAEEAPTWVLRYEAYCTAGKALLSLKQYELALDQYEKAIASDPNDVECRQKKGILLGRLKRYDEARIWLEKLVKGYPDIAENWALLGRLEKDTWINSWRDAGKNTEEMREAAAFEDALLLEAIKAYEKGFHIDPGHFYSGINALTLLLLFHDLTGTNENSNVCAAMEGGIRWAVHSALETNPKDYWARVTLADLEVLVSEIPVVEKTYKYAVSVAAKDWFSLGSSRQQLLLLRDLDFRLPQVTTAIKVLDRELRKLKEPGERKEPRLVFLFSGHMIDAPDREERRFPNEEEIIEKAAKAIAGKLDEIGPGPGDLALCGGACGGDLLFAEACLKKGLRLEVRIPFAEPKFIKNSVSFAGDVWRDRFFSVKANENTKLLIMHEELGLPPPGVNMYARNNLWQLFSALAWGPEKIRFICLWNRKGGDGPGGTQHMHDTVLKHSGQVYILDTNELWK